MQFDWSISFGNVFAGLGFLTAAIFAWRDLTWRIKNLEQWRREHMIDADARDQIIQRLDKLMERIEALLEKRNHLR